VKPWTVQRLHVFCGQHEKNDLCNKMEVFVRERDQIVMRFNQYVQSDRFYWFQKIFLIGVMRCDIRVFSVNQNFYAFLFKERFPLWNQRAAVRVQNIFMMLLLYLFT